MRLTRKKILAAAVNSGAYGLDAIDTNGPAWMRTSGLELTPMEGETLDRELDNTEQGNSAQLLIGSYVTVTGNVEFTGAGTVDQKPAYDAIMQAGGWRGATSLENAIYNRVTDNSEKDATFYVYKDGAIHKILGARLSSTFNASVNEVPRIEFTITGLLGDIVANANLPTPDTSAFVDPVKVGATHTTLTINGTKYKMVSYSLAENNEVIHDENTEGEEIFISDFKPELTLSIQAPPLGEFDPFAHALAHDELDIKLTHGTEVGNIVELHTPRVQLDRPSYGSREGRDTYELKGWVLGADHTLTTK